MLRLEDRLRIALGAGLGVTLEAKDVIDVANMLVTLRQINVGAPTMPRLEIAKWTAQALLPFPRKEKP